MPAFNMFQNFAEKINNHVFVIAEIGKNFIQTEEERPVKEYLENAKALAKAAKDAGADAVKFQTHTVDDEQLDVHVVSPHFKGKDRFSWVTRNTKATPLESFWKPLKAYCDEIGIVFFSTPMSRGAAKKLSEVGLPIWKVGSGDILDFVTLDYLASTKKPIIISSGMSTLEELDKSMDFLKRRGAEVILLHCVSRYPCPPEELRLGTMNFLRERYKVPVGFSDHSLGIDSALAAVAMGAKVIEKHFSFSRELWGADHKVSMTPEEFKVMTNGIRALESNSENRRIYLDGFGAEESAEKILQDDEAVFRPYFRKSLMAAKNLTVGTVVSADMLYAMRPQAHAGGLPSEEYENVVGRKVKKALKKCDPIKWEALA